MLQSMYIYTSWVVLSVWYYIIDYILCAQCGGENFTIGPLPTRNRLRGNALSVRPTGNFHNSGGVGAQTTLGNSNLELQLGCSTVSTGLGMIMYAFSF